MNKQEIDGLNREQDRDELENDFLVLDKGHGLLHKETVDETETVIFIFNVVFY